MSLSNLVRVGSVAAVAAGALLLPVALVGLYARQAEAAGALGLVGFLAAFVGTGLLAGMFWTLAFVAPSLAVEAPAVLDTEPTGPLAFGLLFSGIVVGLGWALFGIAMFRAGVFPRVAAIVLVVGALLTIAPLPGTGLVIEAALIWLGFSLLTGRGVSAGQPASVQ